MVSDAAVIEQTKKWIGDVVVGCNFCPFAAHVLKRSAVHYQVVQSLDATVCFGALAGETDRLDDDTTIETIFLIFPNAVAGFADYLDLVAVAERSMRKKGYDGIYQLASFHPLYVFANSEPQDAANYTNRSVYPMLHLLRESSIDKALAHYEHPEAIPGRNVDFARNKGIAYMKLLRDACFAAG